MHENYDDPPAGGLRSSAGRDQDGDVVLDVGLWRQSTGWTARGANTFFRFLLVRV